MLLLITQLINGEIEYLHRNEIVGEEFIQYFTGTFTLNSEHEMPFSDMCNKSPNSP